MKTAEALSALGVSSDTLSAEEKAQLDERGYLYLHNVLTPDQLAAIRARFDEIEASEGDEAGEEMANTKEVGIGRLANLVEKGEEFAPCYTHPRILAAMTHIMGEEIHFDSLNGRNCPPGEGLQVLHRDAMGSTDETGYRVCQSLWILDDFTPVNGATRIVPGTHRSNLDPREAMEDPKAPHPDEELILAPAGSVVVFNGHCWHGGTENRSQGQRRVLHGCYVRRDQEQQQVQADWLSPETIGRLSPAERHILHV